MKNIRKHFKNIAANIIKEGYDEGSRLIEMGEFDPMYPEGPHDDPAAAGIEATPVTIDCALLRGLLEWAGADSGAIENVVSKAKELGASGPLTSDHLMDLTGAADYEQPNGMGMGMGIVSPVIPAGPISPVMASYKRKRLGLNEAICPHCNATFPVPADNDKDNKDMDDPKAELGDVKATAGRDTTGEAGGLGLDDKKNKGNTGVIENATFPVPEDNEGLDTDMEDPKAELDHDEANDKHKTKRDLGMDLNDNKNDGNDDIHHRVAEGILPPNRTAIGGVKEVDSVEDEVEDLDHVVNDVDLAMNHVDDAIVDSEPGELEDLDDDILDSDGDGETVIDQLIGLQTRVKDLEQQLGLGDGEPIDAPIEPIGSEIDPEGEEGELPIPPMGDDMGGEMGGELPIPPMGGEGDDMPIPPMGGEGDELEDDELEHGHDHDNMPLPDEEDDDDDEMIPR